MLLYIIAHLHRFCCFILPHWSLNGAKLFRGGSEYSTYRRALTHTVLTNLSDANVCVSLLNQNYCLYAATQYSTQ